MPGAGRKLLVVEDEPLMASLLAQSLSSANFRVETAPDAAKARKVIDRFDPDILLLDISLGDGPSGIHLAHAIHETRPDIAILILTKHPDAKSATAEGLDLPPNVGFLRKHLVNDMEYLLSAIDKVLTDRHAEVRQDQPATSLIGANGRPLTLYRDVVEVGTRFHWGNLEGDLIGSKFRVDVPLD